MLNAVTMTPKYQWQHNKNVIFDHFKVQRGHPRHQYLPNTLPIVCLPLARTQSQAWPNAEETGKCTYAMCLWKMQLVYGTFSIISATALNVLPRQLWIRVLWGLKLM